MMTLYTEVTRLALGCGAFDAFLEDCAGMLDCSRKALPFLAALRQKGLRFPIYPFNR